MRRMKSENVLGNLDITKIEAGTIYILPNVINFEEIKIEMFDFSGNDGNERPNLNISGIALNAIPTDLIVKDLGYLGDGDFRAVVLQINGTKDLTIEVQNNAKNSGSLIIRGVK